MSPSCIRRCNILMVNDRRRKDLWGLHLCLLPVFLSRVNCEGEYRRCLPLTLRDFCGKLNPFHLSRGEVGTRDWRERTLDKRV